MNICSTILILSTTLYFQHATAQRRRPRKEYSSYQKLPLCSPSDYFRYPKSIDDAVAIVREAIRRNITVKPFGSRHSQTDIICTEGIPVETYGLNWMRLNPDNTATFGTGVSLYEATTFLRERGRAVRTTPAYGNITIGGAVGTGAHGSTFKYNSSISSQVVRMTIIDGLGNVREISEENDLNAFRIHLGLLGFVVDLTLDTHPLYKVRAQNYEVPDSILTDGSIPRLLQEVDQMALYWFPSVSTVVVANWTIVDVNTPGNAYTNDHVPSSTSLYNLLSVPTAEYAQSLTTSVCSSLAAVGYSILYVFEKFFLNALQRKSQLFVPIYTEDGETVLNPAVGYYDRMFAPICSEDSSGPLRCLWSHGGVNFTVLDIEFTFALDDLPKLIGRVKDIVKKVPAAFPVQGILMRFSSASKTYMSTSYGKDSVHFEYYLGNRKNFHMDSSASLAAFQTMSQVLARDFKASAHWGKTGMVYQSKEMLDLKLDPEARERFVEKMREYDPNGVFMNNFGRRMMGTGQKIDVDPDAKQCALLDYCICSKDKDCGITQYCDSVPGYPGKPVCRTRNDEQVLEQVVMYPYPQNLVGWITTQVPLITARGKAKCATQAVSNVARVVVG